MQLHPENARYARWSTWHTRDGGEHLHFPPKTNSLLLNKEREIFKKFLHDFQELCAHRRPWKYFY